MGRRYKKQDILGTRYCITPDNQTLDDNTVTIRDRDTTKQIRIKMKELYEKGNCNNFEIDI